MKKQKFVTLLISTFFLFSCGGGSEGGDTAQDAEREEISIPDMETPDGPEVIETGDLPLVSIRAVAITSTSAIISWYTFVPADSQVEFGTDSSYGQSTPVDSNETMDHRVALTGLSPNTEYHYRVKSKTSSGSSGVSSDFTFTTLHSECPTGNGFYVDSNSSGGDGKSWATAWNSPEQIGWSEIQPGDCITFAEGTYDDDLRVMASGDEGNPVIIKAANPAVLRGNIRVDEQYHHIEIRGFEITNADSDPEARRPDTSIGGSEILFTENYIHNRNGIGVGGSKNIVRNNLFWYAHGVSISVSGSENVIDNNDVSHAICGFWGDADTSRFFGNRNTIRNNFFHDVISEESGDCHPHCDCFQTYSVNPGEEAHDILIENNYCYNICGQMFMGEGVPEQNSHSNLTFRGNVFEKVGAIAINAGGISNMVFDHNTFVDSGIGAIGIDNDPGSIITNNLFYNNPFAYSCEQCTSDYNWIYPYDCHTDFNESNGTYGLDPLLIDPQKHNFTPAPGSPACTAGQGGSHVGAIPCEQQTQCFDPDADGYGKPASSLCEHSEEDCDNHNPDAYPGNNEICTDTVDNDCDSFKNEDCPNASPLLQIHFDGTIEDSSQYGFSPQWEGGTGDFSAGHEGQALSLSGGDSPYVVIKDDPKLGGMGLITISVWAKKNSDTGGTIFLKHICYTLGVGSNSIDAYIQTDTGAIDLDVYNTEVVNDTNWHHYVMTYDSRTGNANLYVDDALVSSGTGSGKVRWDPCDLRDIYIGKNPWGDAFNGLIDEFVIYDTVF